MPFVSKDEYLENVIHRVSIGAGDDEPVLVARVQTMPPDVAGATSAWETEHDRLEKEEVERFKQLWLSLVEREQRLELRLMDLDGLIEQDATVKELENRVGLAGSRPRRRSWRPSGPSWGAPRRSCGRSRSGCRWSGRSLRARRRRSGTR